MKGNQNLNLNQFLIFEIQTNKTLISKFRPKDAVRAIRRLLQQNAGKNHTTIMYTLTVNVFKNLKLKS